MIAAAGFIAQDAVSGTTWGDFLVPGVMAVSPVPAATQSSDVPAVMVFGGKAGAKKKSINDNSFCYGLPGAMLPIGEWDPAGLSSGKSKEEVYKLREAELAHGRFGMIAAAGFLVQERPGFGAFVGVPEAAEEEINDILIIQII